MFDFYFQNHMHTPLPSRILFIITSFLKFDEFGVSYFRTFATDSYETSYIY